MPATPEFLYVGRLSPEKDIDILLLSFKKVLAVIPDARLKIVGDGPIRGDLIQLMTETGLAEHVEFTGARSGSALYDSYLSATCLVLPSSSEPWGLVVNEALLYGCPVVVSGRCGCVPELVANSETGIVFPCGDVNALAAAMIEATHKFQDQRRIAEACLAKIAPYSPEAAASGILNGAKSIVNRS